MDNFSSVFCGNRISTNIPSVDKFSGKFIHKGGVGGGPDSQDEKPGKLIQRDARESQDEPGGARRSQEEPVESMCRSPR